MLSKIIEFFKVILESRQTGIEYYLAQSTDIADLENRQKRLSHISYI